MEKLIEEIIKINSAYKYLRLKSLTYSVISDSCEIDFFYPDEEPFLDNAKASFSHIRKIAKQLIGIETHCNFFKVDSSSELVLLSAQSIIKAELNINNYPLKYISIQREKPIKIIANIEELYYDYALAKQLDKILEEKLSDAYCADFSVKLEKLQAELDIEEILKTEPINITKIENKRLIYPVSVNYLVGKEITEPAIYIKDLGLYSDQDVVICGTIKGFKKATYKSKKNPESEKEKVYYKFILADFTGEIGCIYFAPNSAVPKADILQDGSEVIVSGKAQQGRNSLEVHIRSISLCEIPKDLVEIKIRYPVPEKYQLILPEEIKIVEQANFLIKDEIPEEIKKNTYVVIDLETTGTDANDRITEIAAVKIQDGKICQLFTTLVNPKKKIPEDVIKITGITDEMVAMSPTFEQVAGDLYKFCYGAVLVGHNILEFDLPVLNKYSDITHYYYDEHQVLDTLIIAREKLKGKISNFRLNTVAEYFNITNANAHRAQFDALTTAKIFLELAKIS
ncbi:MAG TPA: exonuclease domain-containing protein [Clostridia bacterium]